MTHSARKPEPHVCLECGETFALRLDLVAHWASERHAPADVQRRALERLRVGSSVEDFPERT
jgi:hypothetical protein